MNPLMGSKRKCGGIENRLIPNDAIERIPEKVRIGKFYGKLHFSSNG